MKKNLVNGVFTLIAILTAVYIAYVIGVSKGGFDKQSEDKKQIDSLIYIINYKEKDYKKFADSLKNYYLGIEKANKLTNYQISKLLNQNEAKKRILPIITDSAKLQIIDSILRSNGYKR